MGSINVAYNCKATASRSINPFVPTRAVTGNPTPVYRWVSGVTVPASKPWFQVDFGHTYYINRYVIYSMSFLAGWQNPNYANASFDIQVGNDGNTWNTVDSVTNSSASKVDRTLSTPQFCRYMRVVFNKGLNANPNNACITEFEVYTYPCANLSALALSQGTLTPAFSSTTANYTATVSSNTNSITVTPTAQNPDAAITVNTVKVNSGAASQPINLNYGQNTITINVTDPDSQVALVYTVVVTRPGAYLSNLVPSSGVLSPAFNISTMSYTDTVDTSTTSITLTPTACDSTGTITVNGSPVTSGAPSQAITLNYGVTTIPVVVTDAGQSNTYNVAVTRPSKYLSQLVVNDNYYNGARTLTPTPVFDGHNTAVTIFTVNAAYDAMNTGSASTQVNFTPTADMAGETITVNGATVVSGSTSANLSLTSGAVTSIPVVSTYSGSSQQYTINVTMATSPYITGFNGLTLSGFSKTSSGPYSLASGASQLKFKCIVENSNLSINVKNDKNAYNMNGTSASTFTVPIASGQNNLTVTTTSSYGVDSMTYTIVVTHP